MQLPKGESFKLYKTKDKSLASLIDDLGEISFSGYIRLTVERKGEIQDGYLLLRAGEIIGAEFQGDKDLFSKDALKAVKKAWKLEGIIDIFKFSDFQTQLSVEENSETLLEEPTDKKIKVKKAEIKEVQSETTAELETTAINIVDESVPDVDTATTFSEAISGSNETSVAENILKKRKERLNLLKKFGLREPEDDFVDAILQGYSLPSDSELNSKSRELKKEIIGRLKNNKHLEELDLYINPSRMHNAVEFSIEVFVKPFNDQIKKEVETTIESTLKEKLTFPYGKGLKIKAA